MLGPLSDNSERQITVDRRVEPVLAANTPPRVKPSNYPDPFASRMAGRLKRPVGDLFGPHKLRRQSHYSRYWGAKPSENGSGLAFTMVAWPVVMGFRAGSRTKWRSSSALPGRRDSPPFTLPGGEGRSHLDLDSALASPGMRVKREWKRNPCALETRVTDIARTPSSRTVTFTPIRWRPNRSKSTCKRIGHTLGACASGAPDRLEDRQFRQTRNHVIEEGADLRRFEVKRDQMNR